MREAEATEARTATGNTTRGSRSATLGRSCLLGFALLLLTMLSGTASGRGASQEGEGWQQLGPLHYRYFGERIPLAAEAHRIAVLSFEGEPAPSREAVESAGLGRVLETANADPWTLFTLRTASDTRVIDLLDGAAEALPGHFLSPVLRTRSPAAELLVGRDLLVRFRSETSAEEAELLLRQYGAGEIEETGFGGMGNAYRTRPRVRHGLELLALANRLGEDPAVRWSEPDFTEIGAVPACAPGSLPPIPPDDPLLASSWGLEQANDIDIDAFAAWGTCAGDPGVRIAILDLGVDTAHPDLSVVAGRDFASSGCGNSTGCAGGQPVTSCDNHGTHVAGPAAELVDNAVGTSGVAPRSPIVSVRVYKGLGDPSTGCSYQSSTSLRVYGLDWAVTVAGARVTVLSWTPPESPALTDMYAETRAEGAVHFSAVGNNNSTLIGYPAWLQTVFGVGGIQLDGNRWVSSPTEGSNYGPNLDIVAPASEILVTDRVGVAGLDPGDYWTYSGTSFATPMAAGVAGLVLALRPELDAEDVEHIVVMSATDIGVSGWDAQFGNGLVNAGRALAMAPAYVFWDGLEPGSSIRWSRTWP